MKDEKEEKQVTPLVPQKKVLKGYRLTPSTADLVNRTVNRERARGRSVTASTIVEEAIRQAYGDVTEDETTANEKSEK